MTQRRDVRRTLTRSAALVALVLPASGAQAQAQDGEPAHWGITGNATARFAFTVDTMVARSGRTSLRVATSDEPGGFGSLVSTLPAASYAGGRVRLTVHVRTDSLAAPGAAVWLRADRTAGEQSAFATTQGRLSLTGTSDWSPVSVELDVPENATRLVFGALSMASGQLWVDDVTLATLDASGAVTATRALGFEPGDVLTAPPPPVAVARAASPREGPRPASERGLDNLTAFTRLTAYVRFFYPGDAALRVNWDEFTVRGMRLVETAPTADSLAATLRGLFAPIAPEVAVFRTGTPPVEAPSAATGATGLLFWQHFGYGPPSGNDGERRSIYGSTRRLVPLTGGTWPDSVLVPIAGRDRYAPVPDPGRPFTADLGGGVSARVPLALFAKGTSGDSPARPAPAGEAFSISDRATRLAIVALLWMVPQHFYPYFDVVGRDWADALCPALARAATETGPEQFDETLERLVAMLRDGHGGVYRGGVARATPDVRFDLVEGRIVVTAVGDSAAAAGMTRGDERVAVDGRAAAELLREYEARTSGATQQWIRHVALGRLAAGAPMTPTTLTIRTATGARRDVRLTRRGAPPAEPRPAPIAELRPGVWYVDLDRVTDAAVDSALPQLAEARGVVFDMRGYPRQVDTPRILGVLTDTVVRSARFEVPIVAAPDARDLRFAPDGWRVPPRQPRLRGRVAFLSGGGAISYAESTLGVVEDNRLAPIVGEPSAGTNGNINPITLPGNYRFVWTGMRVVKGDGTPHHGVGVQPTVPVTRTLEDVRLGRDPVLERALDLVSSR